MSLDLYPRVAHEQTPECGPDVEEACDLIHSAIRGSGNARIRSATRDYGTAEAALIELLATKDAQERRGIWLKYTEMYDEDLGKEMKKSIGRGDLGVALRLLCMPLDDMEALLIKWALRGIGTDNDRLYPILCGRSNADMAALKKAYFNETGDDLSKTILNAVGGNLKTLYKFCLQGIEEEYDPEDRHSKDRVKADVKALYKAGEGRWGTDEEEVFRILCLSPPEHLRAVNYAYADRYEHTLSRAFKNELRSDAEMAALFTLGMKLKPYETVAGLIAAACAGIGTDELLLSSTLIRYRPMLREVDEAHEELFDDMSVLERVKKEKGGDLGELYVRLIETSLPEGVQEEQNEKE